MAVTVRLLRVLPLLFLMGLGPTAGCSDPSGNCCKVCTTGKACGDTCIAATDNCNVGPGCACDANGHPPPQ